MNTESLAAQRDTHSFRRTLWRYAPVILWMAFISFASSGEFSADNTSRIIRPIVLWLFPTISNESLATVHLMVRKASHFAEYALLAILAGRVFRTSSRNFLQRSWFRWAVLLVSIYALLDEYHQSFVPSRTASIYDSLIDIAGGVTALVLYASWVKRRSKPKDQVLTTTYP